MNVLCDWWVACEGDGRYDEFIMPEKWKGKKGKARSLDIASLTILNFTTSEVAADWQWLQYRGAGSGSPEPALTDYWAHSMQPAGILRPSQAR